MLHVEQICVSKDVEQDSIPQNEMEQGRMAERLSGWQN